MGPSLADCGDGLQNMDSTFVGHSGQRDRERRRCWTERLWKEERVTPVREELVKFFLLLLWKFGIKA